jgi:hypothetical protein
VRLVRFRYNFEWQLKPATTLSSSHAHEKSRPKGRLFCLARNAIIAWQPEPKRPRQQPEQQQRPKQQPGQQQRPKQQPEQQQRPKRPEQQQPEPKLPEQQPEQQLLPSYRKQPEPQQPSARRSGETFSFFRSLN